MKLINFYEVMDRKGDEHLSGGDFWACELLDEDWCVEHYTYYPKDTGCG